MPDPLIIATARLASVVILAAADLAALSTAMIRGLRPDLEQRLLAVEKEQARTSGLLEGLGSAGRTHAEITGAD